MHLSCCTFHRKVPFQDVAKAGLKFGDEDPDEEKAELQALTEKFRPLLDWLKKEAGELVREGQFVYTLESCSLLRSTVHSRGIEQAGHQLLRHCCGCPWIYRER